jgi:hypothetical protein
VLDPQSDGYSPPQVILVFVILSVYFYVNEFSTIRCAHITVIASLINMCCKSHVNLVFDVGWQTRFLLEYESPGAKSRIARLVAAGFPIGARARIVRDGVRETNHHMSSRQAIMKSKQLT